MTIDSCNSTQIGAIGLAVLFLTAAAHASGKDVTLRCDWEDGRGTDYYKIGSGTWYVWNDAGRPFSGAYKVLGNIREVLTVL